MFRNIITYLRLHYHCNPDTKYSGSVKHGNFIYIFGEKIIEVIVVAQFFLF